MSLENTYIYQEHQRSKVLVPKAVAAHIAQQADNPIHTSERGLRTTPENQAKYLYRMMWVDPDLRAAILDIRQMDKADLRVKKIHRRTASMCVKGGLKLKNPDQTPSVKKAWDRFERRLNLNKHQKLHSDARGLMMEGNLPIQWVLQGRRVMGGIRMPSETLLPNVAENGWFKDPTAAYEQYDLLTGAKLATFALWQLTVGRIDPDNYDDYGSMGRPYMDASRKVWKQLCMIEEDLVIRRRMRAPQRMSHILEGASETDLKAYRDQVEKDQAEGITTDYYSNRKGGVTALGGDANLEQIADVVHLLDTFFSGSPAPKGLFGYAGDLNRDILEDLKRDFFEEVDALQEVQAQVYQTGFELQLLLDGVHSDNFDFSVQFAERRTETANQATDRALKQMAAGASFDTIMETMQLDPETEKKRLAKQREAGNPYPEQNEIDPTRSKQKVSVTQNNAPKGESSTAVSNK